MKVKKDIEPRIKTRLLQGHSITHNQALSLYGTSRLSEYIRRLRAKGMNIKTEMCTAPNGDQYGVYSLVIPEKVSRIQSREYVRV